MRPSLFVGSLILVLLLALPVVGGAVAPEPGDRLAMAVSVRALRLGDRGEPVAVLQGLLAAAGVDPGPVDGIFGPRTEQAVRAAQARYGLTADGLAGRLTVGALRAAVALPAPARADGRGMELVLYQAAAAVIDPAQQFEPPARTSPDSGEGNQPGSGANLPARPAQPVGLTFNGLPQGARLDRLLTALADRGMQATFFVTGETAEAHPAELRRLVEAGHQVGSMGYQMLDMRRLSPVVAGAHLRRADRAIAGATGVQTTHFRPPLGHWDATLSKLAAAEGLTLSLWTNISLRPAPGVDPDRLTTHWVAELHPGAVLMLPADADWPVVAGLLDRMNRAGFTGRSLHLIDKERAS